MSTTPATLGRDRYDEEDGDDLIQKVLEPFNNQIFVVGVVVEFGGFFAVWLLRKYQQPIFYIFIFLKKIVIDSCSFFMMF
jgi:hypothetical protein